MAINPLQLPQAPQINSLADWSPLERLVQNWQAQQKEAAQNEQAYRDVGGGQGQSPQGGFLSDLGRKFGLLPEAAPPQVAAVPARVPQAGTDPMANYSNAIANIESGGRYDLLGPVTKTGDRAIGKYQVMGNNVPEWTAAALGKPMNVADFRASPEAQEAVFKHRFGMYAQKYGPENAAKAWFAGEGGMNNPNARDQLGTSVASYAEKFRRNADLPAVAQGGDMQAPSPPGVVPPLQERAVPAAPVVASDAPEARAVQNLTSGQPAAAAGLDRETLARMARNPVTRNLAFAVLQKQMSPGTYSFQQIGDKLIRTNDRSGAVDVVMEDTKPLIVGGSIATRDVSKPGGYVFHTPPVAEKPLTLGPDDTAYVPTGTPGQYTTLGGGGGNKAQRELAGRTYQADQLGLQGQKREFFLANGKIPTSGEDLTASQLKAVKETEDQVDAGHSALDALERATEVSKKAFQGFGASTLGSIMSNAPSWVPGHEAGVQTRVLENTQLRAALSQLQAAFGRNPSNREDAIMIKLQGSVNEPQDVRKEIFKEAKQVLQERLTKNQRKSEQMRSGEYFKRGGGPLTSDTEAAPAAASEPSPAAAATTAKPSLSDFMIKARAANPGVSEGELARFWKQKYGG